MNYKFASLIVVGLALSAGPQGVVSAQPVRHRDRRRWRSS